MVHKIFPNVHEIYTLSREKIAYIWVNKLEPVTFLLLSNYFQSLEFNHCNYTNSLMKKVKHRLEVGLTTPLEKPSEAVSARVGFHLLQSNQWALQGTAMFQHIPWQDFSSVNNLNPFLQLQSKLPTVFLQKWSHPPLRVWHSSISVTPNIKPFEQLNELILRVLDYGL